MGEEATWLKDEHSQIYLLAIYLEVSGGGVLDFTVLSVPGNHPKLVLHGVR